MEELIYDGYCEYENVIDPMHVELKRAANQIKKSRNRVDIVIKELDKYGYKVIFSDYDTQDLLNSIKYSYIDNDININNSKKLILIKDMGYNDSYNDFHNYPHNLYGNIEIKKTDKIDNHSVLNKESGAPEMILKFNKLFKLQIKFLIEGLSLVLFSLIGLIFYYKSRKYIIHPTLYIATLIMGLGWSLTALGSMKTDKGDINHDC